MALQRAPQPLAQMLEMFVMVPLFEPPSTSTASTTTATTAERPPQTEDDIENGPTTATSSPEAMHTLSTLASMVYIAAVSIQAMAQRLAYTQSQLTQLLGQIRSWVRQAISEFVDCMQAFMVATIQDRLTLVDNRIDAFERRVYQSLIVQPVDMTALQKEIQQLQTDMTVALAVLVVFLLLEPSVLVVNLFAPEDPSHTSLGKRSHTDDPNTLRLQVGMTKEQDFNLVKICSRQDQKLRQAHGLKRMRGGGPSGHAPTIEEATKLVEGGHTQPETSSYTSRYVDLLVYFVY